jgi:hypothetical protein
VEPLPSVFMLIFCSSYCLTLEMEALYFSEKLVDIQQPKWRYIPEDHTLQGVMMFSF